MKCAVEYFFVKNETKMQDARHSYELFRKVYLRENR